MPAKKLLVSLDAATADAVERHANAVGVTAAAYAYHAVRSQALGVPFEPVPRVVGLGSASAETRAEVSGRGVKAKRKARRKQRKGEHE